MAALLVRGGSPNIPQILAVPVFMVAVAAVWFIAEALSKHGAALARPAGHAGRRERHPVRADLLDLDQ